jgi:hypothetical protein
MCVTRVNLHNTTKKRKRTEDDLGHVAETHTLKK